MELWRLHMQRFAVRFVEERDSIESFLGGDCLADTTLRYMEEKMKGEIKSRYAFKKKLQTGGKNDGKFRLKICPFR